MKVHSLLLAAGLFWVGTASASGAESIEQLMEYAKQPIVIEKTVNEQTTVQVPITKTVRTIERYGLFKRKCRVVYRTVTEMVSETRTSSRKTFSTIQSVASGSSEQSSTKVVPLDAPLSAGAIAQRVIAQMGVKFPANDFPLTADQDGEFPVNLNSTEAATDGIFYQFVIDPQSNPNFVDVIVFAKDPSGEDAQASADKRLSETEAALKAK